MEKVQCSVEQKINWLSISERNIKQKREENSFTSLNPVTYINVILEFVKLFLRTIICHCSV